MIAVVLIIWRPIDGTPNYFNKTLNYNNLKHSRLQMQCESLKNNQIEEKLIYKNQTKLTGTY